MTKTSTCGIIVIWECGGTGIHSGFRHRASALQVRLLPFLPILSDLSFLVRTLKDRLSGGAGHLLDATGSVFLYQHFKGQR